MGWLSHRVRYRSDVGRGLSDARPLCNFSQNWQLAMHLKLNELIAAQHGASNRMIGIESLDEQELREVAEFYVRLAERAKVTGAVKEVHSIDEDGMPTRISSHA